MITRSILFFSCLYTASLFAQSNGGFEAIPYMEQETGPGMILVEGGVFDLSGSGTASDTVKPFYISAKEESNAQYCEYLRYIHGCYSEATYRNALPDTTVWLKENLTDSLKHYLLNNYLRAEAFKNYPVVGVSPEQIINYAWWKTDRMNEMILIREGILDFQYYPIDSNNVFSTERYLGGNYKGLNVKAIIPDMNGGERHVRMEDGIFLPPLRLPAENEWKIAAAAIGDKNNTYVTTPKELGNWHHFDKTNYFWYLYPKKKTKKKKAPEQPGVISYLWEVDRGTPNHYLIYNLSGNVSEWVISKQNNYVIAGGSWEKPGFDLSAVYNADSSTYTTVSFPALSEKKPSAAVGFRLAMDHMGNVDPKRKRVE
ncbi:MAG: SUMF1/EgtB/PvdO family nonheme iron enzyme [Bacteroidia bacterium]